MYNLYSILYNINYVSPRTRATQPSISTQDPKTCKLTDRAKHINEKVIISREVCDTLINFMRSF